MERGGERGGRRGEGGGGFGKWQIRSTLTAIMNPFWDCDVMVLNWIVHLI